jgi:hypothetical protein
LIVQPLHHDAWSTRRGPHTELRISHAPQPRHAEMR